MLRSQGIPARMVVGYKGGEFNYVGNYLVVRQGRCACLGRGLCEAGGDSGRCDLSRGAACRRRLAASGPDAGQRKATTAEERSLLDRASKSFDYARWLWNDYVLRLTSGAATDSLLRPLASDYEIPVADLLSVDTWKRWFAQARRDGSARTPGGTVPAGAASSPRCWPVRWPMAVQTRPSGLAGARPRARARRSVPVRPATAGRGLLPAAGVASWRRSACAAGQGRHNASSPATAADAAGRLAGPRRCRRDSRGHRQRVLSSPVRRLAFPTRNRKRRSPRSWSGWNTRSPCVPR